MNFLERCRDRCCPLCWRHSVVLQLLPNVQSAAKSHVRLCPGFQRLPQKFAPRPRGRFGCMSAGSPTAASCIIRVTMIGFTSTQVLLIEPWLHWLMQGASNRLYWLFRLYPLSLSLCLCPSLSSCQLEARFFPHSPSLSPPARFFFCVFMSRSLAGCVLTRHHSKKQGAKVPPAFAAFAYGESLSCHCPSKLPWLVAARGYSPSLLFRTALHPSHRSWMTVKDHGG